MLYLSPRPGRAKMGNSLGPASLTSLAGRSLRQNKARAPVSSALSKHSGQDQCRRRSCASPVLPLALARAGPRDYFALAARAMELGLFSHTAPPWGCPAPFVPVRALSGGCPQRPAAPLVLTHFFYCITRLACGVRQLPAAAATTRMFLGLPNYEDWANWRAAVLC